jgi:hypothetical protein
MGRDALTICEPYRDALPLVALPSHSGNIAIFTPGLTTPAQEDITGIVIDMLYI